MRRFGLACETVRKMLSYVVEATDGDFLGPHRSISAQSDWTGIAGSVSLHVTPHESPK